MKIDDVALMSYLVKHLQPLTEANPSLLANYVAALLKNNKSKKELQASCVNQLLDFLGDEAKPFVVNLFRALEDGSIIVQRDNHGSLYNDLGQASDTPDNGDNMESSASQSEKPSKANLVMFSDHEDHEEDVSDDDRNHKHRRHVSRSCSPDKDVNEGPVKKRSRPANNSHFESGISRSSDDVHIDKDRPVKKRPGRDYTYSNLPRFGGESILHGMARRPTAFCGDARLEIQNGFSRGVSGRSRGANPLIWAREQRIACLNGSDYNIPILPGPSTTYAGRTSSNSVQPSWAGYVQSNGVTNGAMDQTISVNTGIQGSRGVSVSAAVGAGMTIGSFGRLRCPDFEERGYCLRGDLCPLEHGANRIVVKDVQSLSKFNLPIAHASGRTNAPGPASNSVNTPSLDKANLLRGSLVGNTEPDLYDPDQPLWNKNQENGGLRKMPLFRRKMEDNVVPEQPLDSNADILKCDVSQDLTQGQSVWHDIPCVDVDDAGFESMEPSNHSFQHTKVSEKLENKDEKREKMTRMSGIDNVSDKRRYPTDKGGFHPRSQRNAVSIHERALRTLFVSFIPKNINKKELLKAHFQKFGEIMDIHIPSQSDRAFVQFLQPEGAEAALKSPEAVMGNRFIRLSWAKRDSSEAPYVKGNILSTLTMQKVVSEAGVQKETVLQSSLQGEKHLVMVPSAVELDPSVKETTPDLSGSQRKREELEHLKQELQKKQEELAQRRDEFRRKLETLSKQNIGVTEEIETVNTEFNFVANELKSAHSNSDSVQVKEMHDNGMKQIPVSMADKGLQVNEESEELLQVPSSSAQTSAGSAPSSRSVRVPSSGSSHRGPFWYKIDNRTTVFRIVPPFPDKLLDLTTLNEHFLHYGDLVSVELDEVSQDVEGYRVTFSSRSAAELAFTQGKWFQGTVLQFSWVNPSSSIAAASSTGNRNLESSSENVGCRSATKSPEESKSPVDGSTLDNESNDNIGNIGMAKVPEGAHDLCLEMVSVDNIIVDV